MIPGALLGVPASIFAVLGPIHLFMQLWYHTQLIGNLGVLEYVFVTPSHHRAHHGSNPEYIDKNYGNFLIIWDRLFGTFEPEAAPVQYGLTKNIGTYNPLRIAFVEWVALFKDSLGSTSLRGLWNLWLLPAQSSGGVSADHKP